MSYRSKASYGKRQEYAAISKLLNLGYDVYLTLVDDQAIDCIIRINKDRYIDVQIKARSKECQLKNRGYFPQLRIVEPRDNYFFIFYSELEGKDGYYWIIPSTDIEAFSKQPGSNINRKKGKGLENEYSARVAGSKYNPFERFEKYRDNKGFKLLK